MLFVILALTVVFFVAPRLVGGVVGSTIRTAKHATKVGINSTIEAGQAVKTGYSSSPEDVTTSLKQNVAGFAERLSDWAKSA